jgi:hypothetical protein
VASDEFIGEGGISLLRVREGTEEKIEIRKPIYGKGEEIGDVRKTNLNKNKN